MIVKCLSNARKAFLNRAFVQFSCDAFVVRLGQTEVEVITIQKFKLASFCLTLSRADVLMISKRQTDRQASQPDRETARQPAQPASQAGRQADRQVSFWETSEVSRQMLVLESVL